jgi:hypothetical protein
MNRIPIKSLYLRDALYEKHVFLHARINEYVYKGIGTLYPAQNDERLFIDVHLTEQAAKDAYVIHIINLNQRLSDLLKKVDSDEYDFEIVERDFQISP